MYLCIKLRPASPGTLRKTFVSTAHQIGENPFLRIGMSQLGYTFVIISQVVKNGEFDIFGNDPSGWNHSFVTVESLCPNIDFPLWIEWSRHLRQPTVLPTISLNVSGVSSTLSRMIIVSGDMSQDVGKVSGPQI